MSYGQSTLAWLVTVVWYRLCRARAQEASIASHRTPLIPTLRPPHLPHPSPPHTPRTASSTSPPHLARLRPLQAARKEDGKLSYAHTRSTSARCPSYEAQAHAPTFVYPFARRTAYTPPLLATSGHPFAQDQLDQAGQDRRDQLLLLASRPVELQASHTSGSPAHTHACIFIRQVQALL